MAMERLLDRRRAGFCAEMAERAEAELEVENWLARGRCFGRNAERIGEDAMHACDCQRRLDLTTVEDFNSRPHGPVQIGRRGSVWYETTDVDAAVEATEACHVFSRRVRELEARLFACEVVLGQVAAKGVAVDETLESLERLYAERTAAYWGWLADESEEDDG